MITTLDAGLVSRWVTGNTVYGSHRPLREGLEGRSQAYALAVACSEQVEVQGERKRVDRIAVEDGYRPPRACLKYPRSSYQPNP